MMQIPYADDPTITDASLLWRRIHPSWVVADENCGGFRVSSAAFDNSPDGTPTSINLEEVARAIGVTAEEILRPFVGYGMASLTAGQGRACHQTVGRFGDDDPTHGFIAGQKTKSVKTKLAAACIWVISPPVADCG